MAKFQRFRDLLYKHQKPIQIDHRVCFMISAPRSGTTWLKQALNSHPEIYCTENRFFGGYSDFVIGDKASTPRMRITLDKYVDSFLLHYNWEQLNISKEMTRLNVRSILHPPRDIGGRRTQRRRALACALRHINPDNSSRARADGPEALAAEAMGIADRLLTA